ncbi:hypothetical protein B0A48_13612 [Cryoendolithus antarcticus]|uniref:NAD(P)-binding domain-containing protein n=1 Tax=Cryoendolithus antarcticus TaxID=1507870 RepID=A0A1V8SP45_9PEZI|nr:hypothetical protein B0A48_13612 [Cryoendolithus antarcticus]
MKIVIAGATGNIGHKALEEALHHPDVTIVVALVRRELDVQNPKLQTLVKQDFSSYSSAELEKLQGAQGCIWALGGPLSPLEVHSAYPRAALKSFSTSLAPHTPTHKPFHFILLSGALIPRTENGVLSQLPVVKTFVERGHVEQEFEAYSAAHEDWQTIIVRPSVVVAKNSWPETLLPAQFQIGEEVFAAALVDFAVHGSEEGLLDNAALKEGGERALARKHVGGLGAEVAAKA